MIATLTASGPGRGSWPAGRTVLGRGGLGATIRRELERCTVFVAIGTSGVVHPAASFAGLARERGARTYYIGPDAPANTPLFDQVFPVKATELAGCFAVEVQAIRMDERGR